MNLPTENLPARKQTPAELALFAIGHGPVTASMLAGTMMQAGVPYLDCLRVAKEALAALVISKHAEVLRVNGTDLYRLPASTPITPSQSERV